MLAERHKTFHALHQQGCFVIPNPWDMGSARMMAASGAVALATSSSAFAFTLGRPDMGHVTRDEALKHAEDIVRATYDFAAQHPEVLNYIPCYCGCGAQGHKANESCFVAKRDPRGNVLQWDEHGFGCTICVDVARESMQLYNSGADVASIRAAIERRWAPGNAAGRTPTPAPPSKK